LYAGHTGSQQDFAAGLQAGAGQQVFAAHMSPDGAHDAGGQQE
jgi:hypothetical protein